MVERFKPDQKYVVNWDPSGKYWEGAVVSQQLADVIEQEGGAVMPCSPELFAIAGFSGYAKRSWGSGWPLDSAVPTMVTPISVYYTGEPHRALNWQARLVGAKGEGVPLRLVAAESRANVIRPILQDPGGKFNVVDVGALGDQDANGGWTVGGAAQLSVHGPGMISLALFGCARGMRVAWLAVSLTT